MNKNIMAGLLGVAAVGVVIYQIMFAGGPATPPSEAGAPPAAPGAALDAGLPAAAGVAGPTRLTSVEVNIDELLKGVQEVTFDYDQMRIDRDPLAALVGKIGNQKEGAPTQISSVQRVLHKRITGIIFDSVRPVAVVDDDVVTVGYVYPDGVKVKAIEKDKVVFQLGDSDIPVEMKEP